MKILYVCTANICRSASAARLLRDVLRDRGIEGVEVRSAGTQARDGMAGCTIAPALQGVDHRSRPLTADLLGWADLVLPAARDHLATIAALAPAARSKTFTIRQAGRLATWMQDAGIPAAAIERRTQEPAYPPEDPRHFVTALPVAADARGPWLAEELDALRGLVPVPASPEPAQVSRWRRRAPEPDQQHSDDVPDPHELGISWHEPAHVQLREATDALADLLAEVLRVS